MEEEKIEVVEHTESKFDDLKPRTEMADLSKEEKKEILEKSIEKEEKVEETNELKEPSSGNRFLVAFITTIYAIFSIPVIYVLLRNIIVILPEMGVFGLKTLVYVLFLLLVVICPYILFVLAKTKKKKKLVTIAAIYEVVVLLLVAVFFLFAWPKIKSSINDQWRCITGPCP